MFRPAIPQVTFTAEHFMSNLRKARHAYMAPIAEIFTRLFSLLLAVVSDLAGNAGSLLL